MKKQQMGRINRTYEWETPDALFKELDAEFHFTLDACASPKNAKCERYYTVYDDALHKDWSGEVVFMHPPCGHRISKWVEKACLESSEGTTVVCLLPARTDADWWHDIAMQGEVRFIRGKIRFAGCKTLSPYAHAIVIFRNSELSREIVL